MYYRRYKGYIEQQIEAIALVLAKILGFKDAGNYSMAETEAGKAFQDLSGMNIATVLALPESMVAMSFRSGIDIDAAKALAAAMLLEEYASIATERNLEASAYAAMRRALALYVECLRVEDSLRTPEWEMRIKGLLQRIGDETLEGSVRDRLDIEF